MKREKPRRQIMGDKMQEDSPQTILCIATKIRECGELGKGSRICYIE